ncbi:hypothetical protein C8J57DRAFT_1231086 [Mycena rebaudengoi]|nr:hypothetical protein C8J57DRAFT_1231086 [Mycena rebaudengoi]
MDRSGGLGLAVEDEPLPQHKPQGPRAENACDKPTIEQVKITHKTSFGSSDGSSVPSYSSLCPVLASRHSTWAEKKTQSPRDHPDLTTGPASRIIPARAQHQPPAIFDILQRVRYHELFQPAPSIGLPPFDILQRVRRHELFQPVPSIGLSPFDVSQKERKSPAIIRNLQRVQRYELFPPMPSIGLPPFDIDIASYSSWRPAVASQQYQEIQL